MADDTTDPTEDDSALGEHEDGRRQYGEADFLDSIKELENPTTGDIANVVGCSRQAALYRLNGLEDEGRVSSTIIGQAKVWRIDG